TELNLVPMIDIFTVLVTFLLMTAVFSRITIVELDLPSGASASVEPPRFRLEVIVREEGFGLPNGASLVAPVAGGARPGGCGPAGGGRPPRPRRRRKSMPRRSAMRRRPRRGRCGSPC